MYLLVKNKDKTITIKEDNINSLNATFDSSEADEMVLGGAVPSELKVSVFNEQDQFQDYKFFGSTITLFNDKDKALGTFVCSNPVINEYLISLEANDYLANADVMWNGAVFPLSEWELLLSVCNQLNFTLAISQEDLPCANVIVTTSDGIKGTTCRNILRYIAEANGMFCYMDGWGRLDFKSYDFSISKKDIPFSDVDDLQVEEVKTFRDGVRIDNDKVGGGTSSYLEITNNPILSNLSDANIQLTVQEIYKKIKGMDYYATNLKTWDDNNDLWLGDYYTVENIRGEIIPTIVMQINIGDGTIQYQGFGDTFEKKQTDAAEEAGMAIESFDEEVDFGKTNNAMRINAKSGTFTICEKKVDNVSKFTRVFLNASGRFTYTNGKEVTFAFYADNIKIKEFTILSRGTQDFSYAFMADTRQAKTNVYSLKVNVNDGEEIDILPFRIELALLVKSGEIDDVQATDQLFVEAIDPLYVGKFTFAKLYTGDVSDRVSDNIQFLKKPLTLVAGPWDISAEKNGSIIANLYEKVSGERMLYIKGDDKNLMKTWNYYSSSIYEWSDYVETINEIKIRNCYDVGENFVVYLTSNLYSNLHTIDIGSTTKIIYQKSFNRNGSIKSFKDNGYSISFKFENGVTNLQEIGEQAFNYANFLQGELYFDYSETSEVDLGNGTITYMSNGPTLNSYSFGNVTGLEKIDFKAIRSLPQSCFEGATSLVSVSVYDAVTNVTYDEETGTPTIDSCVTLGSWCFSGCTNLCSFNVYSNEIAYSDVAYDVCIPTNIELLSTGSYCFQNTAIDIVYAPGLEKLDYTWTAFKLTNMGKYCFYKGTEDEGDANNCKLILENTSIASSSLTDVIEMLDGAYGFTEVEGYVVN